MWKWARLEEWKRKLGYAGHPAVWRWRLLRAGCASLHGNTSNFCFGQLHVFAVIHLFYMVMPLPGIHFILTLQSSVFTVSAASFVCIQELWQREIMGTKLRLEVLICHEWRNGMADSSREMGRKVEETLLWSQPQLMCSQGFLNVQWGRKVEDVRTALPLAPPCPAVPEQSDGLRVESHILEKHFYLKNVESKRQ